jgi:hypothetical protein
MDRSRDLIGRLKAADTSLQEERMPRERSRRVAKRVSAELDQLSRPSRVGWIPMLTFVAGAVLVLLFLRWSTGNTAAVAPVDTPPRPAMAVHVTGPDCRSHSGETTQVWGACSLVTAGPSMRIDTVEASQLEVADRTVRLHGGSALFDVDKVQGDPVRVLVPQGQIVVVGTRFRVIVEQGHSEVELYEGRLEFHDANGEVTPIVAGQVVTFGASPSVVPPSETPVVATEVSAEEHAPAPSAGRSKPKSKPDRARAPAKQPSPMQHDAAPVIEAAERLRREGRYGEAAAVLRDALTRRWPTRTADVLSYELGRLLQRRIRDEDAACQHWQRHLERFAKSRYRSRIERAMATLQCKP